MVMSVPARNLTPTAFAGGISSNIFAYSSFRNAMYSGVRYFVNMPFSGFHHFNSSADTYTFLRRPLLKRAKHDVQAEPQHHAGEDQQHNSPFRRFPHQIQRLRNHGNA